MGTVPGVLPLYRHDDLYLVADGCPVRQAAADRLARRSGSVRLSDCQRGGQPHGRVEPAANQLRTVCVRQAFRHWRAHHHEEVLPRGHRHGRGDLPANQQHGCRVLRHPVLYRLSPLSERQGDYPHAVQVVSHHPVRLGTGLRRLLPGHLCALWQRRPRGDALWHLHLQL